MKYKAVLMPLNSLPVVVDLDSDSLTAVTKEVSDKQGHMFPLFIFDMEADKAYRVVNGEDGYFITDDAEELLGIATPPEDLKRISGTMEMDL